jgi:hypothetical protein
VDTDFPAKATAMLKKELAASERTGEVDAYILIHDGENKVQPILQQRGGGPPKTFAVRYGSRKELKELSIADFKAE